MSVHAKITKLENLINHRFSARFQKTDVPVIFHAYVMLGGIKKGSVPDKLKVSHADWDRFENDTLRFKKCGEKSYQEQLAFSNEIKKAIDFYSGWKD